MSEMKILTCERAYDSNGNFVFYFTLKSKSVYSQRIVISDKELIDWSCTCNFGNIGRYRKEFILTDKKCKHINKCIEMLKELNCIKNG